MQSVKGFDSLPDTDYNIFKHPSGKIRLNYKNILNCAENRTRNRTPINAQKCVRGVT
jgi:hypothetical protein